MLKSGVCGGPFWGFIKDPQKRFVVGRRQGSVCQKNVKIILNTIHVKTKDQEKQA